MSLTKLLPVFPSAGARGPSAVRKDQGPVTFPRPARALLVAPCPQLISPPCPYPSPSRHLLASLHIDRYRTVATMNTTVLMGLCRETRQSGLLYGSCTTYVLVALHMAPLPPPPAASVGPWRAPLETPRGPRLSRLGPASLISMYKLMYRGRIRPVTSQSTAQSAFSLPQAVPLRELAADQRRRHFLAALCRLTRLVLLCIG